MANRFSTRALALAFVLLWSSGWVVSRLGIEEIGLFSLLSIRYGLVVLLVGAVLLVTGVWRRISFSRSLPYVVVGVLAHGLYLVFGVGAFSLGASAGLVAFITALQPMVTAALSVPIARENISVREWTGLVLGLAAVLLVITARMRIGFSLATVLLPVASVMALAIGALIQRRVVLSDAAARRRSLPLTQVLFLQSIGAFALVLPCLWFSGESLPALTVQSVLVILWLATVVSLGAYGLMTLLLRRMSAAKVSSLTYLTPPTTMFMAWLAFGERIEWIDLVGLSIALVGVILTLSPRRSTSRKNAGIVRSPTQGFPSDAVRSAFRRRSAPPGSV